MKVSILVPLVLGLITKTSGTPLVFGLNPYAYDGAVTIASTWIGETKKVQMKSVYSPNFYQHHDVPERQTAPVNVCGAPCTTTCFTPAGGGPDPNECHVIADALRFESESIGPLFDIGTGSNNTVVLKYNSCETFFLNQAPGPEILAYCRTDWAALVDYIAPNCQATQNAHGGICVANDQSWFVQVNHV